MPGGLCSPSCAKGPCPTDVPSNVTAKPECVLQGPFASAPNFCALVCDPTAAANMCGHNATCKAAPSGGDGDGDRDGDGDGPGVKAGSTGICTYDDLPGTPHWQPMESPTFADMSVAIDVGFANPLVGWVGGGANGVGIMVKKMVDGGKPVMILQSTFPD